MRVGRSKRNRGERIGRNGIDIYGAILSWHLIEKPISKLKPGTIATANEACRHHSKLNPESHPLSLLVVFEAEFRRIRSL